MANIFEQYSKERIEHFLNLANDLLEKKLSDKEILKELSPELKENFELSREFLDIAKARKRAKESKYKFSEAKYFNSKDLRFSTPKEIADYIAERLKCDIIIDLCSGIGAQSFSFSKQCKKVYSVEINKDRFIYAKNNFPEKNIQFINGDVLSEKIINQIKETKPNIIFCDPERLESEIERNLDSIKPNIKQLIETYLKISPNICIELPPQIDFDKLKELKGLGDFEAEYLSFNNKLNRLHLYFGNLKKSEVSVVDVSGVRIERFGKSLEKVNNQNKVNKPLKYLYEATTAIIKAGLENEFAQKINAKTLYSNKTKLLLTSDSLSQSEEAKKLSKIYKILGYSDNFKGIIKILNNNKIGKVVIKKKVSPEEYWNERKKYEKQLFGKKQACLFSVKLDNKDVEFIAEELE
jgi:hypothetical protein